MYVSALQSIHYPRLGPCTSLHEVDAGLPREGFTSKFQPTDCFL
jgi:hypothetical protein